MAAPVHMLCRLIAPRATFPFDISAAEQEAMGRHVAYLTALMEQGTALAFGPVIDPAGPWGLLILRVADEAEAQRITADDPVVQANLGFRYDILPMMSAVVRGA